MTKRMLLRGSEGPRCSSPSVAVLWHSVKKQLTGGKSSFGCTSRSQSIMDRSQGRNRGGTPLTGLLLGPCLASFFLRQLKITCSGNDVAHRGPSLLTSINNEDTAPLTCLQAKLSWTIPRLRVPSQGDFGLCQIGIQNQTGHNVRPQANNCMKSKHDSTMPFQEASLGPTWPLFLGDLTIVALAPCDIKLLMYWVTLKPCVFELETSSRRGSDPGRDG